MYGDIDERVPRGGASLLTVFALPGAVLGCVGYLVSRAIDVRDPHPLPEAAMMALVIGGLAYGLVVFRGQLGRAAIAALVLGVVTGGLYFLAQGSQGAAMSDRVIPVAANFVILTVALPFLRSASRHHRLTEYPPLYADAWNIPAIVGIAFVFLLVGSALAALVGALFSFIGLRFVREMISEPWFIGTYGAMVFGVAIGVTRQRESAVLAARGIKMALMRVTAPVFAACVTIFVVAVMLKGFGSLMGELSPVATLTAAALVAIIMINAIVGEGGRPENVLFGASARLLAVVLLFLMSLAVYGLYLRVTGEGWTPNRIAGAVVILVTALYAPTYAAAGLTEQWAILRQGNVAISALLVLIAGVVQTPLFRPYDWSAASQLSRMDADPDGVSDRDLGFLRDRLGAPGRRAFDELAAGDGALAAKAQRLGDRSPTDSAGESRIRAALAAGTLRVHPEGAALGAEVVGALAQQSRVVLDGQAVVVLDGDDVWLIAAPGAGDVLVAQRLERRGRFLSFGGRVELARGAGVATLLGRAADEGITYEVRAYRVPTLGGQSLVAGTAALEEARPADRPAGSAQDPLGPAEEAPR